MTTTNKITIISLTIFIAILSLWYGQDNGLLPVAASPEAEAVDGIFKLMMTIATGLFLLVEGVLIYSVIRFRRKAGDDSDGPPIEGNVSLEILWTAIPTVIVLILSVYSFDVYNSMGGLNPEASRDPGPQKVAQENQSANGWEGLLASASNYLALGLGDSPNNQVKNVEPLSVDVNAIQYAFLFTYPDSGIVTGELHVPVGKPVKLNISAGDVIHAFWVPQLRIKQDAIPGRETKLSFNPEKIGEYPIICAELCGPYHGAMKTQLIVESEEDYQGWLESQQVAQSKPLEETIARSDQSPLLTPYAEKIGVNDKTLDTLDAQIH
ncbi:cytochrome c oxidase subunit II [Euhalothece natronophila Z-M001]|uniref:Cytochrome c oxidase subunit 2 n=1 Tax=Euhalothece natronophila Z-M001 TaxID=522448 RepID=A0A5B8NJC1_9CHRO|nr:cytochrome c oxidase subunit II [Euhalothece natronophila]QDZ39057.1 cytochrome c oxidase subunit II [Euhalothece natronophila Z-M001]